MVTSRTNAETLITGMLSATYPTDEYTYVFK